MRDNSKFYRLKKSTFYCGISCIKYSKFLTTILYYGPLAEICDVHFTIEVKDDEYLFDVEDFNSHESIGFIKCYSLEEARFQAAIYIKKYTDATKRYSCKYERNL